MIDGTTKSGTTRSTKDTKKKIRNRFCLLRDLCARCGCRGLCGLRGSLARVLCTVIMVALSSVVHAQPPAGAAPPPKTPREAAPIDLTGYWVSIVTEDWRFRMITAPKGDYPNVPLNAEGKKIADAWDPAKDEASGDRCKAYGAPNLMRIPARFHITWANDTTLKIESDAGMQTRLLYFTTSPPTQAPSRQGSSVAEWGGRGAVPGGPQGFAQAARAGFLKVVTTRLIPGYLQSNGVPYSNKASITEHFDLLKEANGDQWLIVDAIVEDPQYLMRSFVRSTHFRKQADAAGWDPAPCIVRW
jgi:hypothetical protein